LDFNIVIHGCKCVVPIRFEIGVIGFFFLFEEIKLGSPPIPLLECWESDPDGPEGSNPRPRDRGPKTWQLGVRPVRARVLFNLMAVYFSLRGFFFKLGRGQASSRLG